MNTISLEPGRGAAAGRPAETFSRLQFGAVAERAPVWLPAPPVRKSCAARPPANRSLHATWRPVQRSWTERVFLTALSLASLAGITYGFSCLVDLVQNWAVFGAGINRLIQ